MNSNIISLILEFNYKFRKNYELCLDELNRYIVKFNNITITYNNVIYEQKNFFFKYSPLFYKFFLINKTLNNK